MLQQAIDFRDESDALHALLAPLSDADLARPTRFKGWTIDDIVGHLHFWNAAARRALLDEAGFVELLGRVMQGLKTGLRAFEDHENGGLKGRPLLAAWRDTYRDTADHFAATDPKRRLKWAGPDMSARSSITARLMETWAHGQAAYDLLGVDRVDADRIHNIAVLGVNTFGWTFANRGLPVPERAPHVRLSAPSGAVWIFNDATETERVEGSATEFCQVVAQTRNVADTQLRVVGSTAARWMAMAQCFAGPPHEPPSPGQRHHEVQAFGTSAG
jgi:uncharacterized protein (TIGR03084 family)